MPQVTVTAPSRLHFGLLAFADSPHAFGGVGAMISEPGLKVQASQADEFSCVGPLADRAAQFVQMFAEREGWPAPPACRLEILAAPPEHHGLGLGTQLGLSIAAALDGLSRKSVRPATTLAKFVGRCNRSAVGALGFDRGGLLVDRGLAANAPLQGSIADRLEAWQSLPTDWRFLLIRTPGDQGLSGRQEAEAFQQAPQIPSDVTERLRRIALDSLIPSAAAEQFEEFSQALGEYGRAAGECFSPIQGGAFASPQIAELVGRLAAAGAVGAGQSSWGPTVFAVARSAEQARDLRRLLCREYGYCETTMSIAAPNNSGAHVTIES